MNKHVAVVISLLLTFAFFNSSYAVTADSSSQSLKDSFVIPSQLGIISDSFIRPENNKLVILIQDLHGDKETQTNIKNIIANVDKNHGFANILIEGLYNKPVWLAKENSRKTADTLFEQSYLSGAEYYALSNDNLAKVLPLDDKKLYRNNIHRLGYLTLLEDNINNSLSKSNRVINSAKNKIYSTKNKKIDTLVSKYHTGKISQKTFYLRLKKYINDADLSNTPNIIDYYSFLKLKKINNKKLDNEMLYLNNELKKNLSYAEYSKFTAKLSNTANYANAIENISAQYNINLKNYKEIENYITADKAVKGLDLVAFVDEEKSLIRKLKIKYSKNPNERLLIVLDDLYGYYKDFATNKLTEYGYNYLTDFGIDKFVNLWANFLKNKDIYDLASLLKYFDEYNRSNIYRSKIFVQNILHARQQANGNIIAVMGGFHTREVTERLKLQGISYVVITPSMRTGINKNQNSIYKENILRSLDIKYNAIPAESILNDASKQEEISEETPYIKILAENYDLGELIAPLKRLSGGLSGAAVFLVTTEKGQFILKEVGTEKNKEAIRYAVSLQNLLLKKGKGKIPVSEYITPVRKYNIDRNNFVIEDGGKFYTVQTFLSAGKTIKKTDLQKKHFISRAAMAAQMHNITSVNSSEIEHGSGEFRIQNNLNKSDNVKHIKTKFEDKISEMEQKLKNKEGLNDSDRLLWDNRYFLMSQLNLIINNLGPLENKMPRLDSNEDLGSQNFKFDDEGNVVAWFDFDISRYTYRMALMRKIFLSLSDEGTLLTCTTYENIKEGLRAYNLAIDHKMTREEILGAIELMRERITKSIFATRYGFASSMVTFLSIYEHPETLEYAAKEIEMLRWFDKEFSPENVEELISYVLHPDITSVPETYYANTSASNDASAFKINKVKAVLLGLIRNILNFFSFKKTVKPDTNFLPIIESLENLSKVYEGDMKILPDTAVQTAASDLIFQLNELAKQSPSYLTTLEKLVNNANEELASSKADFRLEIFKFKNSVKIKVINIKKPDPTHRTDISEVFSFSGEKFKEHSISDTMATIDNMSAQDFMDQFKTNMNVYNHVKNIITSNNITEALLFLEQTEDINTAFYVFAHFYDDVSFINNVLSNENINIKIRLYAYAKAQMLDVYVPAQIIQKITERSSALIRNEMIVKQDNSNLSDFNAFMETGTFRDEIFVSYHVAILLYLQSEFPDKKISKNTFKQIMASVILKNYNGSGDSTFAYGEEHLYINHRFANISAHEIGHNFLYDLNIDGNKQLIDSKRKAVRIIHEFYAQTIAHIFINGNGFGMSEINPQCRSHFNGLKNQYEGDYQYNSSKRSPHLGGYSLLYMLDGLLNLSDNANAVNLAKAIENITLNFLSETESTNQYIMYDYTIELLKEYGRLANYDVSKTIEYLENTRPKSTEDKNIWLFPKIDEIPLGAKPIPLKPDFKQSLADAREQGQYPVPANIPVESINPYNKSTPSLYATILHAS